MLQVKNYAPSRLIKIAVVAVIYYVAARLGLILQLGHTNATPVWPPSGIAFTILIISGAELWPGIMLGALLANVTVFYADNVASVPIIVIMSMGISVGNTLEAMTGFYLLRRFRSTQILNKPRHFAIFFIIALVMCFAGSLIGTLFLSINKIITWEEYKTVWFTWWTGDISGVIILTPAMLSWWNPMRRKWDTAAIIQVILLYAILGIYLEAVFGEWLPLGLNKAKIFFIFFLITWCVFRMSQRQLSLVILGIAIFSIYSTYIGQGPFIENTPNESFISLQVFLCVISVSMMFLSTTLNERRKKEEELKIANASLEIKVSDRTRILEKQKEELKEVNRQLVDKTGELENANNESRSFAHIVSHDLREPLRTITNYMQLLEERYKNKLDEEAKAYIGMTINGAKRMNMLIDDLLVYTRIEHNKNEFNEVNLNDILVLVKNNLDAAIQGNGATIVAESRLPVIIGEYSEMIQLFQNLIDNAIKYRSEKAPEIHIGAQKQNGRWVVSVADNGIGIPSVYYDKIFVIFQRLHTREEYEGTGIGLAICKRIMEKHGGSIWVDSVEGKGSTFFLSFAAI